MIRAAAFRLIVPLTVLALAACGGSDGPVPVGEDADLLVTSTGAAEVNAGEPIVFTITVANDGPATATGVTITHQLAGAPAIGSITCSATGGASCPAALGEAMSLESLPRGGGLIFHIEVPGDVNRIGPVTSTMTAASEDDPRTGNNMAAHTTTAIDLRNGDYTVFGSNGRQYTLTLNFNTSTYAMVGQQVDAAGTFTRDPDGVSYVFSATGTGTARFRTAPDMVVGGFDFNFDGSTQPYDQGVRPFVASRSFSSDIAGLNGRSFNLMGLNLRRNSTIQAPVLPSTFGDGVLRSCFSPLFLRVDQCPAEHLATYTLNVSNGVVTGRDNTRDDTIHFRIAQSGDTLLLLRAEDAFDNTGRHFRVGLPESSGLAGGSFVASSTRTAWGSTTLSDTAYSFSGTTTAGTALTETADLVPLVGGQSPTGLRRGLRSGDSAPILFTQGGPLYLMLGERLGLAEGTMDIGVR